MNCNLWNKFDKHSSYFANSEQYQNHILEQYKMYVEMADRISSRRNASNLFFLALNSTILSAIGFSFEKINLVNPKWLVLIPISSTIILIIAWIGVIRSYRKLNEAKYKVIGELEKKLPSSPYFCGEWRELNGGKDLKKYIPLSKIEIIVPLIFGILYIMICIFVIWKMN